MKQKLKIIFSLCCLLTLAVGCGAKDEESGDGGGIISGTQGQTTDPLKEETPICYDLNKNCPSYVAKIVTQERVTEEEAGELKDVDTDAERSTVTRHCTGVLVNATTMLTTATCIPKKMRFEGADCSSAVHIFFPETQKYKASRFRCSRVVKISDLEDNVDASLWDNNVVELALEGEVSRESIRPSNAGLKSTDKLELWKVSTEIESGSTSFIKRFDCDVIKESYANPFNDGQYSTNSALGNCYYKDASNGNPVPETAFYKGAEGGAVLIAGKFAGLSGQQAFSQEAFQALQTSKLAHETVTGNPHTILRPMNFVTNVACLARYFNGNRPSECDRDVDEALLKQKRDAIAASNVAEGLDEAKASIRTSTQHDTGYKMKWVTQFSSVVNQQVFTKHIPTCFYKTDQWLKKNFHRFILGYRAKQDTEMSLDGYVIDIKLDGLLKPRAIYKKANNVINYGLTIRPKDISKDKDSEVSVRGEFLGQKFDDAYPAIPVCKQ